MTPHMYYSLSLPHIEPKKKVNKHIGGTLVILDNDGKQNQKY